MAQLEIIDIAVAHVLEDFQLFAIAGNQDALVIQVADRAGEVLLGVVQILLGGGYIGLGSG